jgi:hypothetical protein
MPVGAALTGPGSATASYTIRAGSLGRARPQLGIGFRHAVYSDDRFSSRAMLAGAASELEGRDTGPTRARLCKAPRMAGPDDDSGRDLERLEERATSRGDYAWGQMKKHARRENQLLWLSGLAAGGAGVLAVLAAPAALTAVVAFASAFSTALGRPTRAKHEHAVRTSAEYKDIAWRANQAAKNDPDRTTRLKSLNDLQTRMHELERSATP